jgi:hypothetical protein
LKHWIFNLIFVDPVFSRKQIEQWNSKSPAGFRLRRRLAEGVDLERHGETLPTGRPDRVEVFHVWVIARDAFSIPASTGIRSSLSVIADESAYSATRP